MPTSTATDSADPLIPKADLLDIGEGYTYARADALEAARLLRQAIQVLLSRESPRFYARVHRARLVEQLTCLLGMDGGDWEEVAEELVDEVLAEEEAAAA